MPETIEQPIWDNTEGFTQYDYMESPSFWTITAEYNEGAEHKNSYYKNTPILNQGNVWACSVFWITKAENEADYFDTKRVLDAMAIWDEGVAEWVIPDGWKKWWSMWWALWLMKNKGYIAGWFFCNSIEDISSALAAWQLCYTGTNKCNWTETKKTWYFTPNTVWTGHLFAIVGIDFQDRCLIAANSWWEGWWKEKWHFRIKFQDMKYLYSIVAIVDKVDKVITPEISQDMKDADTMKDIWIWNWFYPDNNLEKIHAVLMVMRAFWDENISDDEAIRIASEEGIATNLRVPLTRKHFLYMIWRAAYWTTKYEYLIPDIFEKMWIIKSVEHLNEPITRYHAVLIIARMLRNLWQID